MDEILGDLATVQQEFPGAQVICSTFEQYAAALAENAPPSAVAALPVVTAEVGDTWVHGAVSDPVRLAFDRRASRIFSEWPGSDSDPAIINATRYLVRTVVSRVAVHHACARCRASKLPCPALP